ncbi:MAG: HD domain-containing phosphohydrolase [Planctomycetota bacterium]
MTQPSAHHDGHDSRTPNGDALQSLGALRASLAKLKGPEDLTVLLPAVSSSLDQVMAEHQGMADELLCLYEQLGIIFEVTRKLAIVQSETEVIDLMLTSLRRSFEERTVFAACRRRSGGWALEGSAMPVNEWLGELLDRACARRAVIVEAASEGAMLAAVAEVMIGPVLAGSTVVCSLVFFRTHQERPFRASEMLLVESLTAFCGDLIRNHRLVRELREMSIAMVRSLVNAVDQKDEYTCGHSLRVAYYATVLARRLGLGEVDLQMLQWAGLLHDVGKIGIRDNVLKKEGKLTAEEFSHIKEHPVRSHKVVQEVPQLSQALDGILYHHERYDGSGYPAGRKGEQIPLQARIIQIADVFDALTSNRSYRRAYDWQRALEILQEEAGKTVDPRLQKTFDALIRETLKDDADAWHRLVERANSFMQGMDAPGDRESDDATVGRADRGSDDATKAGASGRVQAGASGRVQPGASGSRESTEPEGE